VHRCTGGKAALRAFTTGCLTRYVACLHLVPFSGRKRGHLKICATEIKVCAAEFLCMLWPEGPWRGVSGFGKFLGETTDRRDIEVDDAPIGEMCMSSILAGARCA
jgi:hypothetical protein